MVGTNAFIEGQPSLLSIKIGASVMDTTYKQPRENFVLARGLCYKVGGVLALHRLLALTKIVLSL